jgi:tetratricopeptide (TPR) repeat protein
MTIGLAYYVTDAFEEALDYFEDAEKTKGWYDGDGKEVIYLLKGNAYARLDSKRACVETYEEHLEEAWTQYDAALSINPTYARAKVGQAGVLRQMAFTDFTKEVDVELLDQASAAYKDALHVGNPPESADIEAKVNFGMGQVYFVRYIRALEVQEDGSSALSKAAGEFEQVVQEYNNGNDRIENMAGHAYARLGLIALERTDLESTNDAYIQAVKYYSRAIELVSPYYQAYYFTRLGEVHLDADQIPLAMDAYENAIRIARTHSDEQCLVKYTDRLDEIRISRTSYP